MNCIISISWFLKKRIKSDKLHHQHQQVLLQANNRHHEHQQYPKKTKKTMRSIMSISKFQQTQLKKR